MTKKGSTSSSTSTGSSGDSTSSRLQSRAARNARRKIEWSDCDMELLQRAIATTTATGALISFSKTSDGGALHLRVMDGQDEAKEYASSPEDANALLEEFAQLYA